jgi:hypothetical protein
MLTRRGLLLSSAGVAVCGVGDAAFVGPRRALLKAKANTIPLAINATAGQIAYAQISTNNGSGFSINWGDGVITTAVSGTQYSHTYAGAFSGNVILTLAPSAYITRFTQNGSATASWAFNIGVLGSRLTYLGVSGSNTITGSVTGLTLLTVLNVGGLSTIVIPSSWTGATANVRQVYCRVYTVATAVIDALLISLNSVVVSWATEKTINLKGARTSASDAAAAALQGKGVTVTVTP